MALHPFHYVWLLMFSVHTTGGAQKAWKTGGGAGGVCVCEIGSHHYFEICCISLYYIQKPLVSDNMVLRCIFLVVVAGGCLHRRIILRI